MGVDLDLIYKWLDRSIGRGGYQHNADSNYMVGDATSYYFHDIEHASEFASFMGELGFVLASRGD